MLINEYTFLGKTKLSHPDGNPDADTEAWLLKGARTWHQEASRRSQSVVPEASHLTKQHEKPHSPSCAHAHPGGQSIHVAYNLKQILKGCDILLKLAMQCTKVEIKIPRGLPRCGISTP